MQEKRPFRTQKLNNQSGFTFIELLLVMALIGVMTAFLANIFRASVSLYRNQDLEISVVESANLLNNFLLDNLRRAEGVQDTITDGGDTFTSGSDEIVLRVPALDNNYDPILGVYDYYVFYKDTANVGDFRWRLIPDPTSSRQSFDKLAAEEITSLTISYDTVIPAEASLVTVSFTLEKSNPNKSIDISRSTSVNLRNQ